MQYQLEQKKLELFQQFRKVVPFLLQQISLTVEEKDKIVERMKPILAFLFDLVYNRRNDNNNNNDGHAKNKVLQNDVDSFLSAGSLRSFLRIDDLHDLIINHIAPRVTAIDDFGTLIFIAVRDEQSAKLFSNVESFSAILKCFHRSKTAQNARWIAICIRNILERNPPSYNLLNSLPVVEAFSFIIPLANNSEPLQWISNALQMILENNEEVRKKFATPEFLEIFQGMEKHATTYNANKQFETVLELLGKIRKIRKISDLKNKNL